MTIYRTDIPDYVDEIKKRVAEILLDENPDYGIDYVRTMRNRQEELNNLFMEFKQLAYVNDKESPFYKELSFFQRTNATLYNHRQRCGRGE